MNNTTSTEAAMTYGIPAEESITEGVVTAVAEFSGRDPVPEASNGSTDPLEPLYKAIDPDALDTLFQGSLSGRNCEVTFQYMGYDVTVTDGTTIEITRREPASVATDQL